MRSRVRSLPPVLATLILLTSCGSAPGTTATTAQIALGPSNVWLETSIDEQPGFRFSFNPDRLWFWRVLPIDGGVVMLQGDDNGNSFISVRDADGERWRNTIEQTMTIEVAGEVVLTTTGSHLLGFSLEDGSTVVDEPTVDGSLMKLGDELFVVGQVSEDMQIARLDPVTFASGVLAAFDVAETAVVTDRGLIVVTTAESVLVELDADRGVQRWPVALAPVGHDDHSSSGTMAVAGDLLLGVDGDDRLVAVDPTGATAMVLAEDSTGVNGVWAADDDLVVVSDADGFELLDISASTPSSVGTRGGAGAIGPAAVVDGTAYLTWYAGGTGNILRLTADGIETVLTFPQQPKEGDDEFGEQVLFADAGIYVDSRDIRPGHRAQVLTAYALDGSTKWELRAPLEADWVARWTVESDLVALVYGYLLIPGQVDIYG